MPRDMFGNVVGSTPDLSPPPTSNPEDIKSQIRDVSIKKGLDPDFVSSIVDRESSFNPNAVNPKRLPGGGHAKGLFQFTPDTAKRYGLKNPLDPQESIEKGTDFLADLNKLYDGDKYKIAVHYNSGPANVNKKFQDLPAETQSYLTKILGAGNTQSTQSNISRDMFGNPIGGQQKPVNVPQPIPFKTNPQSSDVAANALNSLMGNALPVVGGAVGELFGGPLGGAAGTGIGETLNRPLQTGSYPTSEDIAAGLKGAGLSLGLSGLGMIPSDIKESLIARRLGKAGNILEQTRKGVSGGIPSGSTSGAQNTLESRLAPSKKVENTAWNKVYQHAENNTQTVQVKIGDIPNPAYQQQSTILGPNGQPIPPQNTGIPPTIPQYEDRDITGAVEISPQTAQYIKTARQQFRDLAQRNPNIADAYTTLNNTSRSLITDKNGQSYLPFDAVKQLRSDIGTLAATEKGRAVQTAGKSIGVQRGTGVATGLKSNLENDLNDSLAQWDLNTPGASKDFEAANLSTKQRVKASQFDKLIQGNIDHNTGTLNTPAVIQALSNETSPYYSKFTAAERKNLVEGMQALRNVSPAFGGALKSEGANFIFATGAAAIGHPIIAAKIAARDLANGILTNPKYAQIMKQLPSAPANSSQAKMLTKSFLKGAMKGAPATLMTPNGLSIPGKIDENGEPKPDFSLQ